MIHIRNADSLYLNRHAYMTRSVHIFQFQVHIILASDRRALPTAVNVAVPTRRVFIYDGHISQGPTPEQSFRTDSEITTLSGLSFASNAYYF